MKDAIERALVFLAARQDASGFWSDWELPLGASRLWTTAYCGWRLAQCASAPRSMLERAAEWLQANELQGGGWGYAECTGADADSTALGILFLRAMGRSAPTATVHRLLSFRRDDGGFATYGFDQAFGSWTASQVEVTATAALALRAIGTAADLVDRAGDFVRSRRRADGLWDSYWWTSPCYATEFAVRLLGDRARQDSCLAMRHIHPSSCFEGALRALVVGEGCNELRSAQNPDGSWPSARVLRLTHRDLYDPEKVSDAGPCFADPRRVFTTATLVNALGSARPSAVKRAVCSACRLKGGMDARSRSKSERPSRISRT